MVERLVVLRQCIPAVLFDEIISTAAYKHLYLRDEQWIVLGQMAKSLKPLQVANTALYEAKIPTISLNYRH